jgi:hypothetical protein
LAYHEIVEKRAFTGVLALALASLFNSYFIRKHLLHFKATKGPRLTGRGLYQYGELKLKDRGLPIFLAKNVFARESGRRQPDREAVGRPLGNANAAMDQRRPIGRSGRLCLEE